MWRFDQTAPQSPRRIEAFVRDLVGDERADEFWRQFRDRFVTRRDIAADRARWGSITCGCRSTLAS